MARCKNCGHESSKTKLTLSIDRDLIARVKARKDVNLSELMEQAIADYLGQG